MIVQSQGLSSSPSEPIVDPLVFEEICALGDTLEEGFVAALLTEFMHETAPLLVELRSALAEGDAPTVRRIAHGLRGSSSQLGGGRFAASCCRLEELASAGDLRGGDASLWAVEIEYRHLCLILNQKVLSVVWRPPTARTA